MQSPRVDEQQCAAAAHPSADWHEQGSDLIKAHSPERMVQVGVATAVTLPFPRCPSRLPITSAGKSASSAAQRRCCAATSRKAAAKGDMQQLSDAGQRACRAVQCCSPW